MPVSNNASYIPTINEFLAHWVQVDTALGASITVKLENGTGVTRADFQTSRDDLQTQAVAVIDALNDQEIARGDIDLKKPALLALLNEFNGMLDGYWSGTPYLNARPRVPGITEGQEKFLAPMRDMFSLWGKLNLFTPLVGVTLPLTLSGGKVVQDCDAMIENLQTAYANEANAAQDVISSAGLGSK